MLQYGQPIPEGWAGPAPTNSGDPYVDALGYGRQDQRSIDRMTGMYQTTPTMQPGQGAAGPYLTDPTYVPTMQDIAAAEFWLQNALGLTPSQNFTMDQAASMGIPLDVFQSVNYDKDSVLSHGDIEAGRGQAQQAVDLGLTYPSATPPTDPTASMGPDYTAQFGAFQTEIDGLKKSLAESATSRDKMFSLMQSLLFSQKRDEDDRYNSFGYAPVTYSY